ncbi:MAG: hypothetical protein ABGZ17_14815 [Planctomycetaceae bacterium]
MTDQPTILQALDSQRSKWIELAGVVGMGIGQGPQGPEIRVFVDSEAKVQSVELPDRLSGYPVVCVASGRFIACDEQRGPDNNDSPQAAADD